MDEDTIKLVCIEDGEEFLVTHDLARQVGVVKIRMEETGMSVDDVIPLHHVDGSTMRKVLEFCKYHQADTDYEPLMKQQSRPELLTEWDRELCTTDKTVLFKLILAANHLDVPRLLEVASRLVAEMMNDMTEEQLKAEFGIEEDYTPEEKQIVIEENQWIVEVLKQEERNAP